MKQYAFSLFTLLILFVSCKNFEPDTINIIDKVAISRIDSTLQSFVEAGQIAGVSALIFEKDEEVYFNAFGYADREAKRPMDRNTIVRIRSMTKPITGVALMQLYEKGLFKLDDTLYNYLPEFKDMAVYTGVDSLGNILTEPLKRPITVRDITRHTAGFLNSPNVPGLSEMLDSLDLGSPHLTLPQMAKKLGSIPLWFQPGSQWEFNEYVREHVLEPLQMYDTRYFVPEDDRGRLASTYNLNEEGLHKNTNERAHLVNIESGLLKSGGSGLTSTLDNYQRFARMLVNNGILDSVIILKPETVKLMTTNHLSDSITKRSWLPSKGQVGFGIDFAVRLRPPATPEENNGVVGEFFWDGAASTLFWVDPVNELTAVLFVQLFPFDQIGLHKNFRDAIYGKAVF
ncbi:MAG: serine hydrolase [Flavobacteriaceae bacterium]